MATNSNTSARPFVLLPLYIYPSPGAWTPLFEAAELHPNQQFLVIVNPYNGPGPESLPDENYLRGISCLCDYENVKILGYVHSSWGARPITDVERDIATYMNWGQASIDEGGFEIRVDGIFVDEAPSQNEAPLLQYTKEVVDLADSLYKKDEEKPLKIFNPGAVPDPRYFKLADYIVVFENKASYWPTRGIVDALPMSMRKRSIAIVHNTVTKETLDTVTQACLKSGCKGVFVSSASYTKWCQFWSQWVEELDSK